MYLGGLCFITDRKVCGLSYEDMVRLVLEGRSKMGAIQGQGRIETGDLQEAMNLRSMTGITMLYS